MRITSSNVITKRVVSASERWLAIPRPRAGARVRLFLAPHAGGSPSWFAGWGDDLPPEVELSLLHLPGRGSRYAETVMTDFASLIATLTEVLSSELDRPYALLGHSLGALIAYELSLELRRQRLRQPERLFVSACPAPHLLANRPATSHLPDEEFVDQLRNLGGTPAEVLDNSELLRLMLPTLRADMTLFESYVPGDIVPLNCPILALGGSEDRFAERSALLGWREYTSAGFAVKLSSGGHFFIREHRGEIVSIVANEIL